MIKVVRQQLKNVNKAYVRIFDETNNEIIADKIWKIECGSEGNAEFSVS